MKELYYENQYISEFDALVSSCVKKGDNEYEITLDETAFFPEQGGQYADEGTINGVPVLDVKKQGENIVHIVDKPFEVGSEVMGIIDFDKRFDRMQNHTGEHVVSGISHNLFGYENVGFHLSDDELTMDLSGELDENQLKLIEQLANEAIYRNLPVDIIYPSPDELSEYEYRSKLDIKDNVRLVKIGDLDICACCAPHVSTTGEIGMIKILKAMRWKGGMRLFLACGKRALNDYNDKQEQIKEISNLTSAKQNEVSLSVRELMQKLDENKRELKQMKITVALNTAEKSPIINGNICVKLNGDAEVLREAVNYAVTRTDGFVFAYSGNDENGYNFVLGKREGETGEFGKLLIQTLNGRGGGRGNMITGFVKAHEDEIKKYFE